MTHLKTALTLALLFIATPMVASAQEVPAPLQTLSDNWELILEPRTEWATPQGDSAVVLYDDSLAVRAKHDSQTKVACEDLGVPMFTLEELKASADSVLFHGADYGMNGTFMMRAECITTFGAMDDYIDD